MDERESEYIIKTKCAESFDFVYVRKNELSFENFCAIAAKTFKVERDVDFKVKLTDNNNISLSKHNFVKIIEYYSKCACFYVKLHLRAKTMQHFVFTPESIENYLIGKNADRAILEEREQRTGGLSDSTRRFLMTHLADYVVSVHGLALVRSQILQFCKSVIILFPSLSLGNGDDNDTDLLCDSKGGGYLFSRIKYLRSVEKRLSQNLNTLECEQRESTGEQGNQNDDSTSCHDDIEFLKIAVVNASNMEVIESKLAATSEHRRQLIRDNHSIDLLENFPYFFHSPKLVEFEYSVIFKNNNSKSFLTMWQSFGPNLRTIMETQYKSQMFVTAWSSDVENLLMLLKLLPFKPVGRNNTASVATFKNSIGKIIIFSNKDGLPDMITGNNHPYIIACGQSQKQITHYFIEVEKHLINVPKQFNFIETFDFYFKVHKVFNLKFDPIVANMMNFAQHFLFKIEDKDVKPTTRMLEIYNKAKQTIQPKQM